MSKNNKEVTISLDVMINKQKNKVLFAVVNGQFVDILLSFLTLPLGKIIKIFENHYGKQAPAFGSLNNLYRSLETSRAFNKNILLDPTSSFKAEYESLKLDISESLPERFYSINKAHNRSQVSYNNCYGGVFTLHTSSFIISDDLQIRPNETGLLEIINMFGIGITDMDEAQKIRVDFGLSEIVNLLKASLTSPTPLSDVVLNKTTRINSAVVESQQNIGKELEQSNSWTLSLKVMTQKSTGKLLYATGSNSFIDFLFSFLKIPLGGEHLQHGETCFKAIYNLYRSTSEFIGNVYFKTQDIKQRLLQLDQPKFISDKFLKDDQWTYGPQTYMVTDDLKVTPYCIFSTISSLHDQKIPISDMEEVELQIGPKEGLSILKASLTSTSVLTDALQLSHKRTLSLIPGFESLI